MFIWRGLWGRTIITFFFIWSRRNDFALLILKHFYRILVKQAFHSIIRVFYFFHKISYFKFLFKLLKTLFNKLFPLSYWVLFANKYPRVNWLEKNMASIKLYFLKVWMNFLEIWIRYINVILSNIKILYDSKFKFSFRNKETNSWEDDLNNLQKAS
jgi:hypothetical protein